MTHCNVHIVRGELLVMILDGPKKNNVGAHTHERNIQIWGKHIFPGWLISMTSTYLHAKYFHLLTICSRQSLLEKIFWNIDATSQHTSYAFDVHTTFLFWMSQNMKSLS